MQRSLIGFVIFLTLLSSFCVQPVEAEENFPPYPVGKPCPPTDNDDCRFKGGLRLKSYASALGGDSSVIKAGRIGCDEGDSNACFLLATAHDPGFATHAPTVRNSVFGTVKLDPELALFYYDRACSLSDLQSCSAAYLNIIGENYDLTILSSERQLAALSYIQQACKPSYTILCVNFWESTGSLNDDFEWPGGWYDYYMTANSLANIACQDGKDLDACFSVAHSLQWASNTESGSEGQWLKSVELWNEFCERGHSQSCDAARQMKDVPYPRRD